MTCDEVTVVVEIPKGSHNKFEIDDKTNELWLDRVLSTATWYPTEYGYIPDTLGSDGDPLDAMVVLGEPTYPGCHIRVRPIGALEMVDEAGIDPKILCVAVHDPMLGALHDVSGVPAHLLEEIEHFFSIYKELEPDASARTIGWAGPATAQRLIDEARHRHQLTDESAGSPSSDRTDKEEVVDP